MLEETLSSIRHGETREALVQLLLEHGNSEAISEWTKELRNESPGGCQYLRFDGSCAHPQGGQCDGAGCADIIVKGGKAYIEIEEDWGPEWGKESVVLSPY